MNDDTKEVLDRLTGTIDDAYAALFTEAEETQNQALAERLRDLAGFLTVAGYGIESAKDALAVEEDTTP